MSGSRGRCGAGLLALLLLAQIGCAARGGVEHTGATGLPAPGPRPEAHVGVVSGEGRVSVKRDGFVETWTQETGRCTRDTARRVAINTFGVGLMFLPPVCALMTAALPGMTTQFSSGRMRRAIEDTLSVRDLHSRLRDQVLIAGRESGRETLALADTAPWNAGSLAASRAAGGQFETLLEVTLTEIRIRDDGTLSSASARIRELRASDRTELATRLFTHDAGVRERLHAGLEPALTALAASIVETLVPAQVAEGPGEAP